MSVFLKVCRCVVFVSYSYIKKNMYFYVKTTLKQQYLDDLFKGQCETQHHRFLRGNHLLVDGVVEMCHLQQSNTLLRHQTYFNTTK